MAVGFGNSSSSEAINNDSMREKTLQIHFWQVILVLLGFDYSITTLTAGGNKCCCRWCTHYQTFLCVAVLQLAKRGNLVRFDKFLDAKSKYKKRCIWTTCIIRGYVAPAPRLGTFYFTEDISQKQMANKREKKYQGLKPRPTNGMLDRISVCVIGKGDYSNCYQPI